jgi:RNA-directed DNA polymerase
MRAYERVLRHKGAAGVDGMTVGGLKAHLKAHWPEIREQLREGRYTPLAVRKVEIPKPGGGKRMLGIPTVQDRLIQQALHQVLSPVFDKTFSNHSYGFRPGRSAAQAVQQARCYIEEGRRWVVDADLEKFFDRVNHDILMSRVAREVKDKRILKLIRSYLQAGMMEGGVVTARSEGTPQGGPLSPLLSNILLTDLDRELERRGHRFCRYADDCNIYVNSKRAGDRVLASMTRFLETQLMLRVNQEKSAVDRPWKRVFLGYTVCQRKYNVRLKVASKSVQRLKAQLKVLFRSGRGRSIRTTIATLAPMLRGWVNYFRYAGAKGIFEELDGWIRRRLRLLLWRQWKRSITRARNLMRLGISEARAWRSATNGRGPWWNSGASHLNQALPKKLFDRLGLESLMAQYHQLKCVT